MSNIPDTDMVLDVLDKCDEISVALSTRLLKPWNTQQIVAFLKQHATYERDSKIWKRNGCGISRKVDGDNFCHRI